MTPPPQAAAPGRAPNQAVPKVRAATPPAAPVVRASGQTTKAPVKTQTKPNQRPDVSALLYQLVSFEIVNSFDQDGRLGELETLGFSIGYRFVEQFMCNHAKLPGTLEVIKFVCKDLWLAIFGKHVDKLQTNHKGVYVLHDNKLSWLSNVHIDNSDTSSVDQAKKYLVLPCGILRGALSNLGIKCTVRAEFSKLPACLFNIHIHHDLHAESQNSKK